MSSTKMICNAFFMRQYPDAYHINDVIRGRSDESSPDGLPFLKNLGQTIYEVELERKRENMPDLSQFRFPDRDY